MVKTTALNDVTHKCLKKVQNILYEKYDIRVSIPDIISYIIIDPDKIVGVILERKGISSVSLIRANEVEQNIVVTNILTDKNGLWGK